MGNSTARECVHFTQGLSVVTFCKIVAPNLHQGNDTDVTNHGYYPDSPVGLVLGMACVPEPTWPSRHSISVPQASPLSPVYNSLPLHLQPQSLATTPFRFLLEILPIGKCNLVHCVTFWDVRLFSLCLIPWRFVSVVASVACSRSLPSRAPGCG